MKALVNDAEPAAVVTLTLTTPALPAGIVAVIWVGLLMVQPVADTPPKVTLLAPVRPVPVRVTLVPPPMGPELGVTVFRVGTAR